MVALVAILHAGDLVSARQNGSFRVRAQRGTCAIGTPNVGADVPGGGVAFQHCAGLDERALKAELLEHLRPDGKLPRVHVRGVDLRSSRKIEVAVLFGTVAPKNDAWGVWHHFLRHVVLIAVRVETDAED